jgi:hypothetical protein
MRFEACSPKEYSMSDDLRVQFRRALERVPAEQPPGLPPVLRRARALRVRRLTMFALVGALAVAGIAAPLTLMSGLRHHPRQIISTLHQIPPAQEAQIVCDAAKTRVLTPTVAAQADGVHISVDNRSKERLQFQVRPGSWGGQALPGVSELAFPFGTGAWQDLGPGEVEVRCLSEWSGGFHRVGVRFATFTVVDPGGRWVSTLLECSKPEVKMLYGRADKQMDDPRPPVTIARSRIVGLQPGDLVEPAGYPRALNPVVRVIRDGKVIAVAYFEKAAGGWDLPIIEACVDVGLSN